MAKPTLLLSLSLALFACGSDSGGATAPGGGGDGGAPSGASEAGGPNSGVTVLVTPVRVAVQANAKQTYACTVSGAPSPGCTWTVVEPGGGTIASTGPTTAAYTAPAAAGTYHVVASSVAMPAATATATVTVVAPTIGDCSKLPAAGTWENVTPPTLAQSTWCSPYSAGCPDPGQTKDGKLGTYGTNAFVLDPAHPGTIYLGTSQLGMWKSTDCGSSWAHVDTGQNAAAIDGGRNWTMVIDPTDSNVLYTVAGYGQGGVFKSIDGGVDWAQILPQSILDVTQGGFMEKLTMDPTNTQHLLASFHVACSGAALPGAPSDGSGGWGCMAESTDAGKTWSLTTAGAPWTGSDGPGQTMLDAKTWFYGTNGCDGLWRTTTGGVSPDGTSPAWTKVSGACVNGSVYAASNGMLYTGGNNLLFSADGLSWTTMNGSPSATSLNGSTPMVDDGKTLFVGDSGGYFSAPLGTGALAFTQLASTPVTAYPSTPVAYVAYDAAHHALYSSNLLGGFWRYVVR